MTILFKFPTRQRPEKFFDVLDQYYNKIVDENFLFLVSLDKDDPTIDQYVDKLMDYPKLMFHIGESKNKIDAINRDVHLYQQWDILVAIADDMIPQIKGFDNIIRAHMKANFEDLDGVLFFNDGYRGNQLNTLPVMGKKYYDRFEHIYYPGYDSLYADNDFQDRASLLGKQKYIDMVIIKHEHPLWTGEKMDDLCAANEKPDLYIKDKQTYEDRILRNFDLSFTKEATGGPTISLCMIVKNELEHLKRYLPTMVKFADEVIIVDTGSTDGTVDFIKSCGIEPYFFEWCNDFSAARNVSIEKATGEYIWWVDADDDLPYYSYRQAKEFLKSFPGSAVMLTLISPQADGPTVSAQLRIFPNRPDIRFKGRVHEQVASSINKLGITTRHLDIKLIHHGYNVPGAVKSKLLRNIELLKDQIEDEPEDFFAHLALARSAAALGQFTLALKTVDRALEIYETNPTVATRDVLIMAFLTKATVLDVLGYPEQNLATLESCNKVFPGDKMLSMSLGEYCCKYKMYTEAYNHLIKVKGKDFNVNLFPINIPSLRSSEQQLLLMSSLYVGDLDTAEECMRKITGDPTFKITR